MNKNNKGTLILIIILLVIFSALAIWGGVGNYLGVNKPPEPENINREFKFNNKLYFYDMLKLVGTYNCQSADCDYATGTIDDGDFSLNYFKEAEKSQISLINNRYAFITDGNKEIILYDVVNSSVINKYKAVKNYKIGISDNYYIIKNLDNKWGIMQLDSQPNLIVDYEYEFIGINGKIDEETKLLGNKVFVVKDINGWKLIDDKNIDLSTYFVNQIYDYNEKYVITKNGSYYYINGIASGSVLLSNLFINADFIGDYVALLSNTKEFYLINLNTLQEVSSRYPVNSIEDVKLEETLNGISISIDGVLKEVVK